MEGSEVANQSVVICPYVEVEHNFSLAIYHLQGVVLKGHI
jgi:hypothetical protein